MKPLSYGVVVSTSIGVRRIIDSARRAEDSGLDYFFTTDHYITPSSNAGVDAWATLAAVAATTKRIKIGTCVTPITFRPPAQLAKIVSTVDIISEGRTVLGVGAGWSHAEFLGFSKWDDDPRKRFARAKEAFELILKLWDSKEPVSFKGKFYEAHGAIIEPKPVRHLIPLWFGTQGNSMLKLAAQYAEGWLPPVPGIPMEEYERVISVLRSREKLHQRSAPVRIACNGTLLELNSKLEQYRNIGCEVALLVRSSPNALSEDITNFSKSIMTTFS